MLEDLHEAGYIYNDLKLDNILVGDSLFSQSSQTEIRLIDFGFSQEYLRSDGRHKQQTEVTFFRGNIIFASLD